MTNLAEPGTATTATATPAGPNARRWAAVGILSVCVLVPFMDVTMVSIDLPKIARELSATSTDMQWIVGGYMLICACGMLIVPAIGDRWGYRRTLLTGLAVFGGASAVCAWAPDVPVLLAGRLLMGVGAAVVLPMRVGITTAMFEPAQRRRAFGVGTATVATATPLGPIAGGALLDHYWFGSLFLLDVIIVALALPLIAWLVPESRPGRAGRPDLLGIGLASGALLSGFCALVVARHGLALVGWLLLAAAFLTGFVRRQRVAEHPVIDLAAFGRPTFIWSQLTITLANLAWTGAIFLLPLYFEAVLHTSAVGVALLLLPFAALVAVGSLLSDRAAHRIGVRGVVVAGLLLFAAGLTLLSFITPHSNYALILVALGLGGLGGGMPQAPALVAAMGALPPRSAANGPGFINALRHAGGAFGVAAGGLVVTAAYLRALPPLADLPAGAAETIRAGVVNVAGVADRLGPGGDALRAAAYAAFTHGVSLAMRGGALLLVTAAVVAMVLPERATPAPVVATGARPDPEG